MSFNFYTYLHVDIGLENCCGQLCSKSNHLSIFLTYFCGIFHMHIGNQRLPKPKILSKHLQTNVGSRQFLKKGNIF